MRTLCCKCHTKEKINGQWQTITRPETADELASHGYCPECLAIEKGKIANPLLPVIPFVTCVDLMRNLLECKRILTNYQQAKKVEIQIVN